MEIYRLSAPGISAFQVGKLNARLTPVVRLAGLQIKSPSLEKDIAFAIYEPVKEAAFLRLALVIVIFFSSAAF